MSIRIFEKSLRIQQIPRRSCFYGGKNASVSMQGGKKSKALKLRARMLMRTKVSMHVETVVLMGKTVTRSKSHVDLGLDVEDYYKIKDAEKEKE